MSTNKNVTFSLPVDLVETLKGYVNEEYIPSLNAGVKEALEEYFVSMEKKILKEKMAEASNDPLFMKDLENNMSAFESSDDEISGGSKEW